MPNLISQANRLNDVEINNNKPVTSGVFRRIGSSVNFLLDLVGANDGDTATTGPLGTLLTSPEIIFFSANVGVSFLATNVPLDLFTFSGNTERHTSWVRKNGSGFSLPFNNTTSTITPGDNDRRNSFEGPVKIICDILCESFANPIPSTPNTDYFHVRINGVTAGIVTLRKYIRINFDAKVSPS